MMKYILLWAFCFPPLLCFSQGQEHLFKGGKVTSSWGSFILEGANVNDVTTLIYGGEGGLSVNKTMLGAYYLCSSDSDDSDQSFSYWHSGLVLGFDLGDHKLIHPYSNFKFGFGRQDSYVNTNEVGETILTAKPTLGLEINIYEEMKIALVGSYNYISRFENKEMLPTTNTSGFSYGVYFTWGWWADNDTE